MLCSYRRIFIVVTLAFAITPIPALGNKILHTLQDEEFPADVHSVGYSSEIAHENVPEGSVERLQQELDDDALPLAAVADRAVSSDQVEGEQQPAPQSRRKRYSLASEEQQPDTSGYAAAFDALLDYYAEVQSEARREVDIPDIHKQTSEKVLFFTVTARMSLSSLRLRVPATLRRVSRVTAETLPDGGVNMSCNVRLGDFKIWGKYDVKVNGDGQTGEFESRVSDRVVHATIRFRELPAAVTSTTAVMPVDAAEEATAAVAPVRCSLEATELTMVQRGSKSVPAVLSSPWVSHVEDVPTTLRVVKQVLNERLAQFACSDGFVAMVRRGYAAPS